MVKGDADAIVSPTSGTRFQFTLDSIYLYAKQMYLWNDALPDYTTFNPRIKYAGINPQLLAYETELFDITQLKINPANSLPFENALTANVAKYSYLANRGSTLSGLALAVANTNEVSGNPVAAVALLNAGDTKVGYIALSSFPSLANAQSYIDAAFAQIAAANSADIIIDLRSNRGGYIETAEYVANLLIPPAFNGKVMYNEQFNSQMQQGKATILQHQPYFDANGKPVSYQGRLATMADVDYSEVGNTYTFSKKGNLSNLKNIYFIVSGQTASASELLINCLRPYLNVKLIGSTTYGKPVGFIGINIDEYTVFMSNFLIKNAADNAGYFTGMQVDIPVVPDNLYELGNPEETCLKATINYINTGQIPVAANSNMKRTTSLREQATTVLPMVERRFKLLKR
ncbi:hypothetical protein GCM10023149_04960 [Mucilaginibacter gynuensis]|uniref:Tail specific protease domain-containing protein n=2 Tax=Mucilaginibacter gynuensis TaxID=1302236 RepID=A0ABP8FT24_9SPHI